MAFDKKMGEARLLEDLWTKVAFHPSDASKNLISELRKYRLKIIVDCQAAPLELIKWLYENQGERRFDASNRLFLVLINKSNFFASWQLKRAKPLLDKQIKSYLDSIGSTPGHRLDFTWKSEKYTVVSNAVFVVHSENGGEGIQGASRK